MTSDPAREALRMIQTGLEALGHGPGSLDGRWGVQTRGAVERLLAADGQAAPAPAVPPPPPGARLIRQGAAGYPVREIILHCSATRPDWMEGRSFSDQVAEIRRWHVQGNGWRDIGYHHVIGRGGEHATGRPETAIGAHVIGHNAGTIGICLIGGHGASAHRPLRRSLHARAGAGAARADRRDRAPHRDRAHHRPQPVRRESLPGLSRALLAGRDAEELTMDGLIATRAPRPVRNSIGGSPNARHSKAARPVANTQTRTVVAGAPTTFALLGDAVREVWPQVAPVAIAGDAMATRCDGRVEIAGRSPIACRTGRTSGGTGEQARARKRVTPRIGPAITFGWRSTSATLASPSRRCPPAWR